MQTLQALTSYASSWIYPDTNPNSELEECIEKLQKKRDKLTTAEESKNVLIQQIAVVRFEIDNPTVSEAERVVAKTSVERAEQLTLLLGEDIEKIKRTIARLLSKKIALETDISLSEFKTQDADPEMQLPKHK